MELNFNQLINEIRKLNPTAEIRVADYSYDSQAFNRIFCSIPMEQLKLPEGFYANEKNGITNKHNVSSYISLSVESLERMPEGITYPNVDVSKKIETTDIREIAIALQRLNPGVKIKLANPEFDSQSNYKIYCDVSMDELALPQPFYANEKNGITNKHTSENGMYTSISVEDLSKANYNMLISTGYNLDEEKRIQYEFDANRKHGINQNFNSSNNSINNKFGFSFDDMKNIFDSYYFKQDANGNLYAEDRKNGVKTTDSLILDRVKFAYTWVLATENGRSRTTTNPQIITDNDYEYAFNDGARETYNNIMKNIQQQLVATGDIDMLKLAESVASVTYKYSKSITEGLFLKPNYSQATYNWFKSATPLASYRETLENQNTQSKSR